MNKVEAKRQCRLCVWLLEDTRCSPCQWRLFSHQSSHPRLVAEQWLEKIQFRSTQITSTKLCQKAERSSLLTHHRMCGTAVFSLCGILTVRIVLAALFQCGRLQILCLIYYSSQTTIIKKMNDVICSPPKASVMDILSMPPPNSLLRRLDRSWKICTIYKYVQNKCT